MKYFPNSAEVGEEEILVVETNTHKYIFVISKMVWPLATMICDGQRPQISSL